MLLRLISPVSTNPTMNVPNTGPLTVKEMFENIADPFWGALTNVTDPGTFNCPYLWDSLT